MPSSRMHPAHEVPRDKHGERGARGTIYARIDGTEYAD
jgi:hypothetical protein